MIVLRHLRRGRPPAGDVHVRGGVRGVEGPGNLLWLGLYEPTPEEFASVRSAFELHELAVEDALKAHQRPKLEEYDDTLFLVVKTARYGDREEAVTLGEILLFVETTSSWPSGTANRALSGRPARRSRSAPRCLCAAPRRSFGPSSTTSSTTTSRYSKGSSTTSTRSRPGFSPEKSNPAERIYFLKRELMEFLRGVSPLLDPLDRLARGTFKLLHDDMKPYFRDVGDHLVRIVEELEGDLRPPPEHPGVQPLRALDPQNEDMRKISVVGRDFRGADDDRGHLRHELPSTCPS